MSPVVLLPEPSLSFQIVTKATLRSLPKPTTSRSRTSCIHHSSKDDEEDNGEPIFYNDFEDFGLVTPPNNDNDNDNDDNDNDQLTNIIPPTIDTENDDDDDDIQKQQQLSQLLSQSKQQEIEKDMRLSKNWSSGNWKVRGFTLDKFKPINMKLDKEQNLDESPPIHVCQIAFDETATSNLGEFNDITETIAVARTDGSVYIIQLGSDYITKFTAVSKQQSNIDEGADDDDLSLSFKKDLAELRRDDIDNSRDGQGGGSEISEELLPTTPFEILYQFYANFDNEPISSILYHDETVYTAHGVSGDIQVWSLDNFTPTMTNDKSDNVIESIPVQTLKGGHGDKVVVLKSLSNTIAQSNEGTIDVNDHNLLLSASVDGSFALWSRDDGDLVYRCQLMDDDGNPTSINCADVDTSSNEHFIYFGLSSGK